VPIAREGFREIAVATLLCAAPGAAGVWLAVTRDPWFILLAALLAVWIFVIAFFRDPRRAIPAEPGVLVAPADGRVTEADRLERYDGFDGPVLKVSIFLAVYDVHVNRMPCGGRVESVTHRPGEFLDARHPDCGVRNEACTVVIAPDDGTPGPVAVRQIAGLIARRIVCRAAAGQRCSRGERYGLIKFGSRTDLIVPATAGMELAVKVNDRVRGGSSIIMRRRG
jgi:phosphatidylserine decarboxylase